MMNPILDNAVKYSMNSNIVKIDTISKRTDNMVYISITNTGLLLIKRDSFSLRSLLSWEKFGEFKTRIWFRLDHSSRSNESV